MVFERHKGGNTRLLNTLKVSYSWAFTGMLVPIHEGTSGPQLLYLLTEFLSFQGLGHTHILAH